MDHYDKIINILDKPYFKNLITMGIDEEHYNVIFERIYNEKITIVGDKSIFISDENEITFEERYISSENGKTLYYENSNGGWYRYEYDSNGNEIYFENSKGYWIRREFDDNGIIVYENSRGEWFKR